MAVAGSLRLRRAGHDARVARRTRRDRQALSKPPGSSSTSAPSFDAKKEMDSCPAGQPKTLPGRAGCRRRFPPCRFLPAPARQDRRGKKPPDHRPRRFAERADLLLQHGLLRSSSRQCPRRRSQSPDQFQDGQLLPRSREERPGPEGAARGDLIFARSRAGDFKSPHSGLRSAVNQERLTELFEDNFTHFGELGAAVSIWQHGKPILELHGGFRDAQRQQPWTADTIVLFWSATKGLGSACLLHTLQEQRI